MADGFEWVHVLGNTPACVIALARDGRFCFAPLATPPENLLLLARVGAGARLAQGPDPSPPDRAAGAGTTQPACVRHCYLFDRTSIVAVDLPVASTDPVPATQPGAPALRWRAGPAFDAREIERDPEHYPRILAAAATTGYVAVLRSDGQLALLSPADGQPLRTQALGAPRAARMHVRGESVGLLIDVGPDTRWIVIPGAERPFAERLVAHSGWPAWSEWTSDGLLLARPDGIRLIGDDYRSDRHLALEEPMRIATLTRGRDAAGTDHLFFTDGLERVHGVDPTGAAMAWTRARADRPPITQLASADGALAVADDERIEFLDARTGADTAIPAFKRPPAQSIVRLQSFDAPRAPPSLGRPPSATQTRAALRQTPPFAFATRTESQSAAPAHLTLWRPVSDPSPTRAARDEPDPNERGADWRGTVYALVPPVAIRELTLLESRLVAVGADVILVFDAAAPREPLRP